MRLPLKPPLKPPRSSAAATLRYLCHQSPPPPLQPSLEGSKDLSSTTISQTLSLPDYPNALHFFNHLRRITSQPSDLLSLAFQPVLEEHAKGETPPDSSAGKLFDAIDEEVVINNTDVLNLVISGLLKWGRFDDALKLLDEMFEPDSCYPPPNSNTIAIVFSSILKRNWSGRSVTDEEICKLVSRFGARGVYPSSIWFTQIILRFCRNRECDKAWIVLHEAMNSGSDVDVASCNALLTGLGQERDFARMNSLMKEMKVKGIKPNVVTYGIMIKHLCKFRRVDEALEVLEKMRDGELDIEPDIVIFNTLIDGLCKVGRQEEGLKLMEKMRLDNKCNPNYVTYNCLIDGFCKAGEIERGHELFEQMSKEGVEMKKMINDGLTHAHGVTKKMINDVLTPSVGTYGAILSPLCKNLCNSPINRHSNYTLTHIRCMSNVPENSVYGGPKPQNHNQRVTLTHLRQKYKKGEPITMVTAYDYPSAVHLDTAGIDICLVGDSASMVVHGHDTTLPITLDEMLVHCRAVARGAKRPLLVGDLPFGSYESSTHQAVDTAVRVLKEGGMDAIKLEGGAPSRITAAKAIVEAGIAVIGHVGLTPQAISVLGGFRPQGKNVDSAVKVVETSIALQEAGCFAVVLECVPAPVAAAATSALQIPTIGIGAGPFCSGQVLVYHDLLGMLQHPHHAKVTPKFCKQYAHVGDIINKALLEYKEEVTNGSFPSSAHSPYKIAPADVDGFLRVLEKMGLVDAASAAAAVAEKIEATK